MAKPKTPTNEATDKIIKHIRAIPGAYAWRNNTQGTFDPRKGIFIASNAKRGVSDILGGLPFKTFKERPPIAQLLCVEVKTGRDKLSDVQIGFLETMRRIGAIVLVVKSYEDFKEQFKVYEARTIF